MASADFTLNNDDEEHEHMREKMTTFLKMNRPGSKAKPDKHGVVPGNVGDWVLLTKDFSRNVREQRAQWIIRPSKPGTNCGGDVKAAVEEALFAMKCLLRGKLYQEGVENKESPEAFDGLEPFVPTLKGKKDKLKEGQGVPSFMIIKLEHAIVGAATMDMNLVPAGLRMPWASSKEAMRKSFSELKDACFHTFDDIQTINADTILKLGAREIDITK